MAIESTKRLLSQDVDCLLYMTGSWLYSSIISAAALEAKFPFDSFAPRHNDVSALSTTCILHGSLDELGVEHKFIYGYPDDKEVLKEIKTYAIASMVKNGLIIPAMVYMVEDVCICILVC